MCTCTCHRVWGGRNFERGPPLLQCMLKLWQFLYLKWRILYWGIFLSSDKWQYQSLPLSLSLSLSLSLVQEPIDSTLSSDDILNIARDSKLHVVSGGTRVVQHTPPVRSGAELKSPDNGCIGYVLRTGFNTSQVGVVFDWVWF